MLDILFKKTLVEIAQTLNPPEIKWAVIGSTNLALQGIDLAPNDIDVTIPHTCFEKVRKLYNGFSGNTLKKLANNEGVEVSVFINNIEVQFCFEYDHGTYYRLLNNNNLIFIEIDSTMIPCFKLENEIKAYTYLGRRHKVKIIEDFLRINASN